MRTLRSVSEVEAESLGTCFVMQPFDGGKFDKRYSDTFSPAIRRAGLEPYRVDQDPGAQILIDRIEQGIRRADICFADITLDNPNIWYELGFAMAAGKDIVMVCAEGERAGNKYPFDIQHRRVLGYKADSATDFQALGLKITEALQAQLKARRSLQTIADMPQARPATSGLSDHEVALLTILFTKKLMGSSPSGYELTQEMRRYGYTDVATALSTRRLKQEKMIFSEVGYDINNEQYCCYVIGETGEEWLVQNQDKLSLRAPPTESGDSLPF